MYFPCTRALYRYFIISIVFETSSTIKYSQINTSNVGFTPNKSLGACGPWDLSGVKPPFSVFISDLQSTNNRTNALGEVGSNPFSQMPAEKKYL